MLMVARLSLRAIHAWSREVSNSLVHNFCEMHLISTRFELSQIGWWLLEVYFGLDASGFETSRMSTAVELEFTLKSSR